MPYYRVRNLGLVNRMARVVRGSVVAVAIAGAGGMLSGSRLGLLSAAEATASELGIVSERPASGPVVETARGFMVPYKATIPGTEIEFEMVPVPGGSFTQGSPDGAATADGTERPTFQVTLEPFWIGKHEVTWSEYRHFMEMYRLLKDLQSRGKRTVNEQNDVDAVTVPTPLYDPSFTFVLGGEPRQPAVTMSHFAARQYTKWLSLLTTQVYRLPSESEWEYACRAGTTTDYSFGDDPSELAAHAWYFENSAESYHNVGEKQPNAWGLYDMHGNVAELVVDQYREDAYQQHAQGKLAGHASIVWTKRMFPHVIRGGSWSDDAAALRSAARGRTEDWRNEDPNLPRSPWWFTDEPALAVGFRLVRPLNRPSAEVLAKFWEIDNEVLGQAVGDRLAEGRGVKAVIDAELPQDQGQ